MNLIKKPHPECNATVYSVYTGRKGHPMVSVGGCDQVPDVIEIYDARITYAKAISIAQRMLDEHRARGLRKWWGWRP